MARGGLTALGTRGRGPLSGRAWSAQSHSETGRGEPTAETPGRHFCGKTSGQLSPLRLLSDISSDIPSSIPSNISADIPATNRNQQQLDFVRKKGVFYGQVSQNANSSVKRRGFPDKLGLRFTDRHSLDFPDTCHLDFPDALHLNFPDTCYLTKRPKSGTTELPSRDGSGRTYRPRY